MPWEAWCFRGAFLFLSFLLLTVSNSWLGKVKVIWCFQVDWGKVGPFLKVECLQLVISSSLHLKTNPQLLSLSESIFANDRVVQDPCFTFLLSVMPIRVLGVWVFFLFCNCLIEKQVPFHFKPPPYCTCFLPSVGDHLYFNFVIFGSVLLKGSHFCEVSLVMYVTFHVAISHRWDSPTFPPNKQSEWVTRHTLLFSLNVHVKFSCFRFLIWAPAAKHSDWWQWSFLPAPTTSCSSPKFSPRAHQGSVDWNRSLGPGSSPECCIAYQTACK